MHTPKAVRAGHPADRLFVVQHSTIGVGQSRSTIHTAWKVSITADGLIHPAYKRPRPATDQSLRQMGSLEEGRNGSQPTAMFKADSFYREVSIADVAYEIKRLKALPKPPKYKVMEMIGGRYLKNGTDTCPASNQDFLTGSFEVRCVGSIESSMCTKVLDAFARFKAELEQITQG